MNQLNTQKKQTLDYSKGMSLKWRNDDDLPSSVEVMGQNDSWNKDPVRMDFAYKGGARIAKFRNSYTSTNALKTNEARYYLLGGKEIRIGEDGKIRAMMYPSYAGSGRTTINVVENSTSTEFSTLDYLGSTARVNTLENGTLKQTLSTEYDSWGREIQSVEVANSEEFDDRFTGKKKDVELGLDYFGSRYLDKDLGMWMSPDKDRQYFNLFGYVGNGFNSINSKDHTGNRTIWLGGAGDYKNTSSYSVPIINKLARAGIQDVYWVPTPRDPGVLSQAGRALSALTGYGAVSDNVHAITKYYDRTSGQFNLIGYSQGGTEAALAALDLANSGKKIDNVILIGSPLTKDGDIYKQLKANKNIENVQMIEISGDLLTGQGLNPLEHFHYSTNEKGQQDALVKDIKESGVE